MKNDKARRVIAVVGIVFAVLGILGSFQLSILWPGLKMFEAARSPEIAARIPANQKQMTDQFLGMIDNTFGRAPKSFLVLSTVFGVLGIILNVLLIRAFWSLLGSGRPRYRFLYSLHAGLLFYCVTKLIAASMYDEFARRVLSSGVVFRIILYAVFIFMLSRSKSESDNLISVSNG